MDNRDVVIVNIIAVAVLLEMLYKVFDDVVVVIQVLILVEQRQVNVS